MDIDGPQRMNPVEFWWSSNSNLQIKLYTLPVKHLKIFSALWSRTDFGTRHSCSPEDEAMEVCGFWVKYVHNDWKKTAMTSGTDIQDPLEIVFKSSHTFVYDQKYLQN